MPLSVWGAGQTKRAAESPPMAVNRGQSQHQKAERGGGVGSEASAALAGPGSWRRGLAGRAWVG